MHVLIGGEGTLAFSTRIELKLSPLLGRRAVGACHFGSFHSRDEFRATHRAAKPIAVELIDRTMIGLGGRSDFPADARQVRARGAEAILLVEFGEDDHEENLRTLQQLGLDG